jgi:1-acyl-sn-glycerol-3-phosphate acyltransferase
MFGVFGLGLNLVALLGGMGPTTERTQRLFQRLIHRNFALFAWWIDFAGLVQVRYHGWERLPRGGRGLVLAANHPSLVDITLLLARVPEAVCIFKPAIRRNPVLGAAARRAGYLDSDSGHDLVREAGLKVAAGQTLVIFPEGTRTPPGAGLLTLKPGFVLIARRAGVPIQLVHIAYTRPVLAKGRAVWKIPPLPARADITVGPCVEAGDGADSAAIEAEAAAWLRSPGLVSALP